MINLSEWDTWSIAQFYVVSEGEERQQAAEELHQRGFMPFSHFPYYKPRPGYDSEGRPISKPNTNEDSGK